MKPKSGHKIVLDLLQLITNECENPDLRDRGYIYFRLLKTDL